MANSSAPTPPPPKRAAWMEPLADAYLTAKQPNRRLTGKSAPVSIGKSAAKLTVKSELKPISPHAGLSLQNKLPKPPVSQMPMRSLNRAITQGQGLTSERARGRMIDQLAGVGIRHAGVLAAMQKVERHLFVDEGLASRAYEDCALPIGHEQTISKPSSVARMIELVVAGRAVGVTRQMRALEIGTGCGYQAAVMAQMFKDVYSIERIRALHETARLNLRHLRQNNLRLVLGDGRLGLPDQAPFDVIILAAAGFEIPSELLSQMVVGGFLIAPVGVQEQSLQLVERQSIDDWQVSTVEAAKFVPLKHGLA